MQDANAGAGKVSASDVKKVQAAIPGLSPEVIQNCGQIVTNGPAEPTPFENRIAQAAKVMGITVPELWKYLNAMGIENNADGQALLDADTTQESDARSIMVEGVGGIHPVNGNVKVARFKAGWLVLKGKGASGPVGIPSTPGVVGDFASLVETLKRVEQRSNEELLKMYNPEASHEILEELRKRSFGRHCIIFNDVEVVDQVNSLKLLRIAHRSDTPSTFTVDGALRRVYRVGEFPMNFMDECPIHGDTILIEGQCESCQDTWLGISMEDRIIVRVARDTNLVDADLSKICDLIERIKKENGAGFLLKRGKVGLIYKELKEEGRLPILRRRVSRSGKSDPLNVVR
jgi:hypothetical protein